ncbi:MAG: glycosyltransferase family 1 protein [Gammaproteobacteria bacterium]|nr:glycosyltransferase family 1 protein [Gammaproteobacteria bacterium]
MHVVHLETGRHPYGGARQALILMRGLKARSVEGTLACTAGGQLAGEARRLGLALRELPMRGDHDLGFIGRFATLLRELQPDLVHVHSRRGADWFGGLAARRAGIPALLTRRVDRSEGLLSRLKYRPYGRVVAISTAIRRQLESVGLRPPQLALVRSAVEPALQDPAWSRERLAREFSLDPRCQLVGCVSQLIARKGHAELLQAWRAVAPACPQARLLLFGQGPLEASLRRRVRTLGLEASVLFAGFRPDLASFIGRLDVLAHAASAEGLGLAVLEAEAAGVPVVAFRAGGVPEIVADGRTGYLVRAGDAAAFAIALTELLQNEARRKALGAAAWDWVAREFRVADMVDAYLTLYRDLAETRSR